MEGAVLLLAILCNHADGSEESDCYDDRGHRVPLSVQESDCGESEFCMIDYNKVYYNQYGDPYYGGNCEVCPSYRGILHIYDDCDDIDFEDPLEKEDCESCSREYFE